MSVIQPIVMPKWGLAMQEGMVTAWHVEQGQHIEKGQEIAEIETSKIANVFESPVSGLLRRRVAAEGENLPVGALLAVVADADVPESEIDAFVKEFEERFREQMAAREESATEPQWLEVGGRRIRYLEAGEGEPVLFLHGFGGDLGGFALNQAALADRYRTIALDLPGHGGSSKAVDRGSIEELGQAVVDVMDSLELGPAHLVGHSLGGAVALWLASRHPARAKSLSLIAPAGLGREIASAYLEGFLKEKRARKLRPVLEMLVADPSHIGREMIEEVLRFKRLDGVEEALSRIRETNFAGGVQQIDLRPLLGGLSCPVLIVWGERDRILPPHQAEDLPPPVSVVRIEASGHLPHLEKADEVNELLARHFEAA